MNTNIGLLMYPRHDEGDPGYSSRNPMYDKSDAALASLAFDGLLRGEHVPVIAYRLSNGQEDEFPASWALPEPQSCASWNTLSSMRAVACLLYTGR